MKSLFGSSAIVATAFVLGISIFTVQPSVAETNRQESQQSSTQEQSKKETASKTVPSVTTEVSETAQVKEETPVAGPTNYVATAYSLRGRTASGRYVSKGIIAADRRVLPLGSRVRIEAGNYSGEYLVADTGGAIKGRRIDIWIPSSRDAMKFGRRTVKLTVLSYGQRRAPKAQRATRATSQVKTATVPVVN